MQKTETNRWLVLVIVCLAQFMVVLDATVVNIALPSIQHGLSFSDADLQWVINAYTLVFGGFLLLAGRAADLLGRKRLFGAVVLRDDVPRDQRAHAGAGRLERDRCRRRRGGPPARRRPDRPPVVGVDLLRQRARRHRGRRRGAAV